MRFALFYETPVARHRFLEEVLRRGHLTDYEGQYRRKDGSSVWILESVSVFEPEPGAELLLQGTLLDITERKRMDEKLRQTAKLESVGLLAGGIAHDFNNLLTTIRGFSDLLLRDLPERCHRRPVAHQHQHRFRPEWQLREGMDEKLQAMPFLEPAYETDNDLSFDP